MNYKRILLELRLGIKFPFSINSQQKLRKMILEDLSSNLKLAMLIRLEKDETLDERYLKFHSKIGIHKFYIIGSSDEAKKIMESNYNIEIVNKFDEEYIAKTLKRDLIDWLIVSTGKEYFYSKSKDLKLSIGQIPLAEIITTTSKISIIENIEDLTENEYFAKSNVLEFSKESILNKIGNVVFPIFSINNFEENYIEYMKDNDLKNIKLKAQCADIEVYIYDNKNIVSMKDKESLIEKGLINKDLSIKNCNILKK